MTSRELVYQTLEFRNNTGKVPRELWTLPWAENTYPEQFADIIRDYPNDIVTVKPRYYEEFKVRSGDMYSPGEYIDEWGCKFNNVQEGIIGEVKEPIVQDEDWDDYDKVHIPEELLSFEIEEVNEYCANTDKFVMAGFYPRPFEQLQFIRGTENLYVDLMLRPENLFVFLEKMHDFYCRMLEKWGQTDVDALMLMDDWGTQNSLLINPKLWEEIFKPMYKDYINIAKKYNKKVFMHSDGNTSSIIPHLIEIGLDAINTQIFCMDMDELEQYKGKITFWGEIDRQHILPRGSVEDVKKAVEKVQDHFWESGGVIAQCEFGPGAKPENVKAVFEKWAQY